MRPLPTARLFLTAPLLWPLAALPAQEPDAPAPMPPTEVVAFKSGQSYVRWSTDVAPGATRTRLRLPSAVHGTLWIESDDLELTRAHARRVVVTEPRPIESLATMLLSLQGRSCTVESASGGQVQSLTGTVVRVLSTRRPGARSPYGNPLAGHDGSGLVHHPTLVVLRTASTVVTLPLQSITRVEVASQQAPTGDWTYDHPVDATVLDLSHGAGAEGGRIETSAMVNGLAWAPSYVLDLLDDGKARLAAKATLVNDAEPLENTRVRLAIGYPNLEFTSVPSALMPTRSWQDFRNAIHSLGDQDRRSRMFRNSIVANVMAQSTMSSSGAAGGSGGDAMLQMPGEAREDLFFFDAGVVSLERGGRLAVPLLDAEIAATHRYDWDLGSAVDRNARFLRNRNDPDDESPPAWHVLRLENSCDAPWTTAPILVRDQRQPVAQSTITYTPRGATTTVRLTKALDLVGDVTERRADGESRPVTRYGTRYEEVEVECKLSLVNRKAEAVKVRVRKDFDGELVGAVDGRETIRDEAIRPINVARRLVWTTELEAGATWERTFTYKVLIAR